MKVKETGNSFDVIECSANELKKGDRIQFFYNEFIDGSVLNGGADVVDIKTEVPVSIWDNIDLDEVVLEDKKNYMFVCFKLDYYEPTWHLMTTDTYFNEVFRFKS